MAKKTFKMNDRNYVDIEIDEGMWLVSGEVSGRVLVVSLIALMMLVAIVMRLLGVI